MSTSVDPVENAVELLGQYGQSHVLRFVDDLDETARSGLLEQIAGQDWATIGALIESHVKAEPRFDLPEHIEPAPCMPYEPTEDQIDLYADARAHGERLLEQGKVAAFVVAGGQGTRLGWHAPKGTYPDQDRQEVRRPGAVVHHDQPGERCGHTRVFRQAWALWSRSIACHVL